MVLFQEAYGHWIFLRRYLIVYFKYVIFFTCLSLEKCLHGLSNFSNFT